MPLETIILFSIIAVVLLGIPVLLGRKFGADPMDLLFGDKSRRRLFGRNKNEDEAEEGKDGGSGRGPKEKNSSRQDLMKTISDLLSYGRRNRFYCIMPGTLMNGDDVASLAVVIVTRNRVMGFNCFGYGGTVWAGSGDDDWRQVINGEEITVESPIVKNRRQKEILDAVMRECGHPETPTDIYGIFTAPDVVLKAHRNTRCFTRKTMLEILKENRYLQDGGIAPKELGKILETHTKKA